jgi:hypothetical protein
MVNGVDVRVLRKCLGSAGQSEEMYGVDTGNFTTFSILDTIVKELPLSQLINPDFRRS